MGLLNFLSKPSRKERNEIDQNIHCAKTYYDFVKSPCGVENFVDSERKLLSALATLINYEAKYPRYFNHPKPTENSAKVANEIPAIEKKFVDNYMSHIANKLLKYSTDRGKANNFNKEVENFRRFSASFLPGTVEYFEKQLSIHFKEYL